MKKTIFGLICTFALLIVGMTTVYAAPQVVLSVPNFNLAAGNEFNALGISAEYNIAVSELTVNSVTSGTKKNTFIMSRLENGKYNVKAALQQGFTANSCTRVNFGYIGHGTWMYTDAAENMNTGETWAGWSGSTILRSQ